MNKQTTVKVNTITFSNGTSLRYAKNTLAAGKKALSSEGYKQCKNPYYMEKGNTIAHYNNVMKVWVFEKK